jgi:hypothetical protein
VRKYTLMFALAVLVSAGNIHAASPGDTIGTTYYDMQSDNGACTRICSDAPGGYHFVWMESDETMGPARNVYYNFIDEEGTLGLGTGAAVNEVAGAGFPTLAVLSDGRAAIAYHNANNNDINFALDGSRGLGTFAIVDVPDQFPGHNPAYWPKIACDSNEVLHITGTVDGMTYELPFVYTSSTDEGTSWSPVVLADTLVMLCPLPVTSRASQKVAIVYGRPRDISNANFWDCDMYYIESADGTTWNFSSRNNVTNYADGDTLRVFSDFDALYDNNDNLHIIWSAVVYHNGTELGAADSSALYHWSSATGIDLIDDAFEVAYPSYWDLNIAKVNIGVDANDNLFALWTRFSIDDTSAGGMSNGDLYYSYSEDNGDTWSAPVNITNTQSNDCAAGNCDSDHWASMDEIVDQYLHILYIHDTDAGAAAHDEGDTTECQVMYHTYANPVWAGVDEGAYPESYDLTVTNYPNPFNASTEIEYSVLDKSVVKLEIYNILGQHVVTLVDNEIRNPGEYHVRWDTSRESSGIYFCRLQSPNSTVTRRLALIK